VFLQKKKKLPVFVLGGGSNILVFDRGFDGLVVQIKNLKFKIKNCEFEVGAGMSLSNLVFKSAKLGLSGLEWAVGIPGTVGGAVAGNAGAFGAELSSLIKSVKVFDISSLVIKEFKNLDCAFAYRESVFKRNSNLIVLEVVLKLKKENKEKIFSCYKIVLEEEVRLIGF